MRKSSALIVAFIATLGLLAAASPSQARDTNWPCKGCIAQR